MSERTHPSVSLDASGRLTDEKLDKSDHAVELRKVRLAEEAVRPADLARPLLELPARHLASFAGVEIQRRRRRAVLEVDGRDAEKLRVRTGASSEGAEDGDGALRSGRRQFARLRSSRLESCSPAEAD